MRRVALGLGAVVVLGGGALAYVVATFDPNHHKGVLIDWVKAEKHRTLVLNGPIELGVWPRLHVRLRDVSLSEHQRPELFAAIREVDLAVQLVPLLKGQLRVGRVSAEGLSLSYQRDAQGRSNIDDLLSPTAPDAQGQPGQPLSFDVEGVQLKDLTAKVHDAKTGVQGTLHLQAFKSGRIADGVATDVTLDAKAEMQQPRALTASVAGHLNLTPTLATSSVLARDVDVQLQAASPEQGSVKSTVKAQSAQWDGAKRSAKAQGLALEAEGTVGKGAGALVLDKATIDLDSFEFDPGQQALVVSKLAAKVDAKQAGQARQLTLQWPNLQVKGESLQGGPLSGSFKLAGPVAAEGQFKSQSPTGSFKSVRLPGLQLDLKASMAGQGGAREVVASLGALLTIQPAALSGGLQGLKLTAKVTEPSLQPLQIQASGQLTAAMPLKADWTLQGDVNGNAFNTHGQLKAGAQVPEVQAQAKFAQLDLNRLLPAPAVQTASAPSATGGPDQTPVDLGPLRSVNGRFDVQVGQLAWRQYRVADAVLLARLQGGVLSLEQLSGAAWGGRFKAQGQAAAGAGQRVALTANAEGINLTSLLKDVMGKDPVEGTAQLKLDVNTTGATVGALTAGLQGTASTVVRDGAVHGINLAKSLREAKARITGRSDAVQKAQQTEKTDFTELSGSFQIHNGVAHNQDLSAKSPFLRLGGAGDIDLVKRRLDYLVNTTVTGTIKGQDGADIDALKGLTVPVKLAGPFDALDWKIAWSGVAVGALTNSVKGQVDEKVKTETNKLQDQLKGKLKGLFR